MKFSIHENKTPRIALCHTGFLLGMPESPSSTVLQIYERGVLKEHTFNLDKLLKFRRSRRDLCRQLLAQILEQDRNLIAQRHTLQQQRHAQLDELRRLGQTGSVDIDGAAKRRFYSGQLIAEMRLVEHNREVLAGQMALCRNALVEADREVKVLEKLAEKQLAEHRYNEERHMARELEEAWLSTHVGEFSK